MDDDATPLSLSGFSDLLSDHMKNKFFPKGHVICRQGEKGNHMYFINSGTVEVSTKKGFRTILSQGDFFGEGALLHPKKIRSSTVKCVTPVHCIEISREYFNKYLESTGEHLNLNLRGKNKTRNESRAKSILRLQQNLREMTLFKGDYLYKVGDEGREVFILEEGKVDVFVQDHVVLTLKPGDLCGEYSVIFSRPRNTSAMCVSDECRLKVMTARDFYAFLDTSPAAKESLHDIAQRREFQKAIVFKTKRAFPSEPKDLRAAFDAADEDSSGFLSLENVRSMLKRMDPSLTEKEVQSILKALDLDESGQVSFEEFKRIFQLDEVKAEAI
jgi:CRP-like cAMP-binding protein